MSDKYIIVTCPHCEEFITVYLKELNCKIFRHGVYKKTLKQINPHLKKPECERLFNEDLIYGCGKPFQLVINGDDIKVQKCGYI